MKAHDYIPLYTYSDYKMWEGNWELIHGYPHAMSPSPIRKHQLIIGKVNNQISRFFETNSACKECEVYSDLDWIVNDSTTVRPDMMIVCGEFKDEFLTFPPVLVVEVLSKSTSMKDRNIKYNLYQAQKVKYYILVNPDNQLTEIFELKNAEYVPANNLSAFSLHNDCNLQFDITAFVTNLNLG